MCVTSFVILEGVKDAKRYRPNLECEPSRCTNLSCYERSRRTKKLFDICLLTCTCLQCCQNTNFIHLSFPSRLVKLRASVSAHGVVSWIAIDRARPKSSGRESDLNR